MAIVTAHVAAVQQLYVAYFNRPADVGGLDYWTNVVANNKGSTAAVSESFAKSPEYIVAYYNLTNAQIVDKIYLNMFGRGASTVDGRSYWVDLLNQKKVTVDAIVAEVAKGAKGTDAESVENKVAAATAFTTALDTPAEQEGYKGEAALTAAKAFITGVTTDATLTAAIAPATLDATVAAVVKAGTPFSLTSALTALQSATKAQTEFLKDNELSADVAVAKSAIEAEVLAANNVINAIIPGYTAGSAAVKTALLADKQKALNTALSDKNKELAAANAEANKVSGLSAAIANQRAAIEAQKEADEAADATATELTIATDAFETRTSKTVTIDTTVLTAGAEVATVPGATAGSEIVLITTNARGNLIIPTTITEKDYPGITALRDALAADIDAKAELKLADDALTAANGEAVLAANTATVSLVNTAYTAVETAQKNIETLADAVADRAEVVALQTEYTAVVKAVTDAKDAFTANGFKAPVALDNATAAATSAADIFMVGDEDAVTISSFGRSGDDSLFVGTQYKLNAGDLEDGDNSAMEVFFVQNGTRTEVHIEKAAYGSDSDDVVVVTLVGVDADDLQLVNGVVSLKAGAAA